MLVRLASTRRASYSGLPLLGIQVHQQTDKYGGRLFERRLDGVMDFFVRMHRTLAFDSGPGRFWTGAPRTAGGRRIAQQSAIARICR